MEENRYGQLQHTYQNWGFVYNKNTRLCELAIYHPLTDGLCKDKIHEIYLALRTCNDYSPTLPKSLHASLTRAAMVFSPSRTQTRGS